MLRFVVDKNNKKKNIIYYKVELKCTRSDLDAEIRRKKRMKVELKLSRSESLIIFPGMLILFCIKQNIFNKVSDLACIEEPKILNFESVLSKKQEAVVSISMAWFGGWLKEDPGSFILIPIQCDATVVIKSDIICLGACSFK